MPQESNKPSKLTGCGKTSRSHNNGGNFMYQGTREFQCLRFSVPSYLILQTQYTRFLYPIREKYLGLLSSFLAITAMEMDDKTADLRPAIGESQGNDFEIRLVT
jgi:hypothetical protein